MRQVRIQEAGPELPAARKITAELSVTLTSRPETFTIDIHDEPRLQLVAAVGPERSLIGPRRVFGGRQVLASPRPWLLATASAS